MYKSLDTAIFSILGNMPRRTATDWEEIWGKWTEKTRKTNPRKQARPVAEADLDRTRVGLSRKGLCVIRSFSSYLHQVGPKWTKWKGQRALWPHVDWSRGEFWKNKRVILDYFSFFFYIYIAITGTTTALSPNNTRRSIVQALGRSWYYEWRFKVCVPNFGRWKAGCCSVMILWVT